MSWVIYGNGAPVKLCLIVWTKTLKLNSFYGQILKVIVFDQRKSVRLMEVLE